MLFFVLSPRFKMVRKRTNSPFCLFNSTGDSQCRFISVIANSACININFHQFTKQSIDRISVYQLVCSSNGMNSREPVAQKFPRIRRLMMSRWTIAAMVLAGGTFIPPVVFEAGAQTTVECRSRDYKYDECYAGPLSRPSDIECLLHIKPHMGIQPEKPLYMGGSRVFGCVCGCGWLSSRSWRRV